MSSPVSTIQSLIGQYPLGIMQAIQWFSDHPTNLNATFATNGSFSGGDLPFGLIYEVHDTPTGAAAEWLQSKVFPRPFGKIANNGKILSGYSSTVPVEEFDLIRPRGLLRFTEPSTTSIDVDITGGIFLELWGLYIPIPLVTPTQMSWTASPGSPIVYAPTLDGTPFVGLSGDGTIALDIGCVGVRVDLTLVPGRLGREATNPELLWGVGWVSPGDSVGFKSRQWINSAHWLSARFEPAEVNHMGYHIADDVVATITCLLPNI